MGSMLVGPRRFPSWMQVAPGLEDEIELIGEEDEGGVMMTPTPTFTPTPTPTPTPFMMRARTTPTPTPTPTPLPRSLPAPTPTPAPSPSTSPSARFPVNRNEMQRRQLETLTRNEEIAKTNAAGAGGAGASRPSTIRALRMPSGKIIFTNVGGGPAGSEEISTRDAGREIRARDAARTSAAMMESADEAEPEIGANGMPTGFNVAGGGGPSPMSPVLRLAMQNEWNRMAGMDVPDGGLSILPETPEREAERLAMDLDSEIALRSRQAQVDQLKMSPQQRAQIANPGIVMAQWAMGELRKIDQAADQAALIEDPDVKTQTMAQLEESRRQLLELFTGTYGVPGLLNR